MCLKPAPLKVRGEAVISALPIGLDEEAISVSGSFLYVDQHGDDPWYIELSGGVSLFDHRIAKGHVGLDGDLTATFGFTARLQFPNDDVNIASVEGSVEGWLETRTPVRFSVEGKLEACLVDAFCRGAEAVMSSDGVAACATIMTLYYPTVDVGLWYADVSYEKVDVRGGFGYRWGGAVDVMGGSCDIGPWRAQMRARAAQAGERSFEVGDNEPVTTLRLRGAGTPPKVTLRGPDGTVISSPKLGGVVEAPGKSLLVEDPQANATVVQLIRPAKGRWTITTELGSTLTAVDRASYMPPPAVDAKVTRRGRRHRLQYIYTQQADTQVRFVERAGKLQQTIGTARPGDCPDTTRRDRRTGTVRCGTIAFRPAGGPGGRRDIFVEVTRDGKPVETRKVGSYVAPAPRRLAPVRRLRIARHVRRPVIAWAKLPGAERYELEVSSEEGYRFAHIASDRCRALRMPRTGAGRSVTVTITAVDADGVRGRPSRLRLRGGRDSVGTPPVGHVRDCARGPIRKG